MKINKNSNVYTVIYILALVLVVGVGLSLVYQALRPTQEENMANDKKRQILAAALIFPTQGESVADLYRQHIVATRVVNSRGMDATGAPDAFAVNMPEQAKLPADRRLLPVFVCRVGEQMKYIVPVYGAGLWGPIWGYIAMNADGQSIYGAYFAHQGETPGLGAEIEKPAFSDQFKGKTLYDVLMEIYVEYGFSKETTVNVVKPGKSGAEEIKAMMDNFRANPPKEIGGSAVSLIKDYKTLELTDVQGNVSKLDMPETSNVLQYFTVDGTKISVRPSGTEPKIKFYIEVKGEMGCPKCYTSADAEAEKKVEAVRKSLGI